MPVDATRWTIWLAMIAYVAALAVGLRRTFKAKGPRPGDEERGRQVTPQPDSSPSSPCLNQPQAEVLQRMLWTAACLLTWAHVLCAFAVHHQWSHAAAYAHTASETAKKIGIAWGGGIYFNYLFLSLWSTDALWWWLRPATYRARARGLSIFVHSFLAFIAVNATVIFESGPVRWGALAGIAGLGILGIRTRCCSSGQ